MKKTSINDKELQAAIVKEATKVSVELNELINQAAARLGGTDKPSFLMLKKHIAKNVFH